MAYRYDAFISYSSADQAWRTLLEADLLAAGLNVFVDKRELEAGKPWPKQLQDALHESRHLIVLWSNKAKSSAWVNKEMATFDSDVDAVGSAARATSPGSAPDRRMLSVLLEGQSDAYATLQAIPDLLAVNAYQTGSGALDQAQRNTWTAVVQKLVTIARKTDSTIPIAVAIVAMRNHEYRDLTGAETIPGRVAQRLDDLLTGIGITGGVGAMAAWYTSSRTGWHPFGGPHPVSTLLDHLIGSLGKLQPGLKFRWEEVDFLSLPNLDEARTALERLEGPLSLVLVDPISLYHPAIVLNLNLLLPSFRRPGTLVLTLPPFSVPPEYVKLRELVRQAGAPLFDVYYHPPVPHQDHATCGVNVADAVDVFRMLRLRVGQYIRGVAGAPGNSMLDAAETPPR